MIKRSLLVLPLLLLASHVAAQAPSSWVGQRVVLKHKPPVKVKGRVVDQVDYHVFTVTQAKGDQLRLSAGSIERSVRTSQVLLLEKAILFYTQEIKARPADSAAWALRGIVWYEKRDYDKALADFNKLVQLLPKSSFAYQNRGNVWSGKKEYDKAIADFNKAIRLDPRNVFAYNTRGLAWHNKKELDRAIADFNEAIRLDSKNAAAYNNRGDAWCEKRQYDKAVADWKESVRLDPKNVWARTNLETATRYGVGAGK